MKDFEFKINLVAVVRVRAADESVARQMVPKVLGTPDLTEIKLANQNNTAIGRDATVTSVDFSIGPIKCSKCLEARDEAMAVKREAEEDWGRDRWRRNA
jgi:hypothetical protein